MSIVLSEANFAMYLFLSFVGGVLFGVILKDKFKAQPQQNA